MTEEKPQKEYEAKDIEKALKDPKRIIEPVILAKWRVTLTIDWGFWSGQLADILRVKPNTWRDIRKKEDITSDAQATREWEASEKGINEKLIRIRLEYLERIMSAIKLLAELADKEMNHH